jgi:hypothetical protein
MRNLGISLSGATKRKVKPPARDEVIAPLEAPEPSKAPDMTLAQKLGLVKGPASRLTKDGWLEAAERSRSPNHCLTEATRESAQGQSQSQQKSQSRAEGKVAV